MKDFIKYEFIGVEVEILYSRNKQLVGIYGTIVDETKNTFLIKKDDGKVIRILKYGNTFVFYYNDYWILVEGDTISKRPWDRIKTKIIKKV